MICPFMSHQNQYISQCDCYTKRCMLWDNDRGQCAIKTACLNKAQDTSKIKEMFIKEGDYSD